MVAEAIKQAYAVEVKRVINDLYAESVKSKQQREGNMVTCMITARKGSTRLANKNIRDFNGLPLLAWSVIQAKCSKMIDEVWLTTDSEEYAEIGRRHGANVFVRPVHDNKYSAGYVFLELVDYLRSIGRPLEYLLTILPTYPARYPWDLDNLVTGFLKAKDRGCDTMASLAERNETFIYRKLDDELSELAIANKKYSYLGQSGGDSIFHVDWFENLYRNMNLEDSVIDDGLDFAAGTKQWYVKVNEWQGCVDVNTLEQFNISEVLCDRFILDGNGASCYYQYRDNWIAKLDREVIDGPDA